MKHGYRMKVLIGMCLCLCIGGQSVTAQSEKSQMRANAEKYNQALYYLDRLYFEDVDFNHLVEESIRAMLETLDPHSSYIPAEELKALSEPLQGEFEGIGIEFAIIKDTLTVQATVAGGPSEQVGLLPGDKIIRVDTSYIADRKITNEDVFKLLRGPKGSTVSLNVLRRGTQDTLTFTIRRDKIPLNSLDAAYRMEGDVLYLKLSRFAAHSADEIRSAFAAFKGEPKGVILDLRGNSGGYLPTAIDIAGMFLSKGDLIVYTEGRTVPLMQEKARNDGLYRTGPLAVIIDEYSASASEIVAGAVQDHDRGIVIGRRSFGKGLVQQALPLQDGSEIRLTIARYHTPSGRVIQSSYEKGNSEDYYRKFYDRYNRGESFSADSISFPDSLKYQTLKLKRTVYGGGGIMPDIFVPLDTTAHSAYYSSLLRNAVVAEYVNALCDENRKVWTSRYRKISTFMDRFEITQAIMDGMIAFAQERGIAFDEAGYKKSEQDLKVYMKALAASRLFSREDYYRIMNETSNEIQTALDALRDFSLSTIALL